MKHKLIVSETIEVCAFDGNQGITIKEISQGKIIAIMPEEIDSLLEALNSAKRFMKLQLNTSED